MTKYFCDRCGKEVTGKTNYSVTVTLRQMEIFDKDMIHPRIENVLCKKCTDWLLNYMASEKEQTNEQNGNLTENT